MEGKNLAIALIVIIGSLVEILNGVEVSEEEETNFRSYFSMAGYDLELLEKESLIKVLQLVCADFSKMDLEFEDDLDDID